MFPNISSNKGNNEALSCSWKKATSIVLKDIIPIEPLWHCLLNLPRTTQKTSGPLTNVKGIILFLQLWAPQPFYSLSHRGMNLDGSCFTSPAAHHSLNRQLQLVGLSPQPHTPGPRMEFDNPYHASNQQRCTLTGSCSVRSTEKERQVSLTFLMSLSLPDPSVGGCRPHLKEAALNWIHGPFA